MKTVLYVVPHKLKAAEERQSCVSRLGIDARSLTPTPLSAFTSVVIANECSKHDDIGIVHTFRPDDAMAAISARKISSNKNFKVVLEFPDNAPRPRSLNKEVIAGVDAWVFATSRLADLASTSGKLALIMTNLIDAQEQRKLPVSAERSLMWVGPLEKNIVNLKEAIRLVGRSDGNARLTVLGTGTARYAMQAVKMSRAIPNPELVQWKGSDYNMDEVMQRATAIVQSQDEPTSLELDLASRRCLCKATPDGFVITVDSPLDAQQRAKRLTDFYSQL